MYTRERNTQILISLLKEHGIKKIVASPGDTNVALVGSVKKDPYFEVFSSVDERSAAYIACGLAAETGEPVAISCTGATASRNYLPGLTEAYYRKLPVLAITSTQDVTKVGHLVPQVIDRQSVPNDVIRLSVSMPRVKDADDEWNCVVNANKAILELTRAGGGPAHINLTTSYTVPFDCKTLPKTRVIKRIRDDSNHLPEITGKVAVFVGSHVRWTEEQTSALDKFCETNDAVVFCDHTSGYKGKYRVLFTLASGQECVELDLLKPDLTIHIGEVSGDYFGSIMIGKEVWRVNSDGEIKDTFRRMTHVFEMDETKFFSLYSIRKIEGNNYAQKCAEYVQSIRDNLPELPFSNIWLASRLAENLPKNSILHLAILNSLRSWNFFEVDDSIDVSSNVGGFGIDGVLSTAIGASLVNTDKLTFCVIGDLAFFYDINSLGNRHISNNLRILLVNNGCGTEFRNYNHHAAYFENEADEFIAANNHFGNKSPVLVKSFVESLGFKYIKASSKIEFESIMPRFIDDSYSEQSLVMEVFTDSEFESNALESILNIKKDRSVVIKRKTKNILGNSTVKTIRSIIKK